MQKFTVFTAILTVVIVVVVAEILVSNYFPSLKSDGVSETVENIEMSLPNNIDNLGAVTTDVINSDMVSTFSNYLGADSNLDSSVVSDILGNDDVIDFEGENFVDFSQNVYIREDQVKSAGFVSAYLEEEVNDGFIFKNIYIDDIEGIELTKTLIRTAEQYLAKVYIIRPEGGRDLNEVYNILKTRSSQGLDTEINETNQFGASSFYMNDSRRENVAFLVVKIGNFIYCFSYPKEYHPQASNLVQLIDLEI